MISTGSLEKEGGFNFRIKVIVQLIKCNYNVAVT
jgi:hypothetical protein